MYVQACAGVPTAAVVAHEFLHTLGAVPDGAPHDCPAPNDGHTCDNQSDLMHPFIDDGVPFSSLLLDPGRDDYYGHSAGFGDSQDAPWLVQLDRQQPFTVTISGTGGVQADVPGPAVQPDVHDDLELGDAAQPDRGAGRGLEARPLERLVRRRRRVLGRDGHGHGGERALRAIRLPADRERLRTGKREELAHGDHVPPALLGVLPVVRADPTDGNPGEGLEIPLVGGRVP